MVLMQLPQVLRVELKLMARFAQCVQVMLDLKNVKHANKRFAYWSELEEIRRKLC
jgi:hypothetical protein